MTDTGLVAVFARAAVFVVLATSFCAKVPLGAAGRTRFGAFAESLGAIPRLRRWRRSVATSTVTAEGVAALALVAAPLEPLAAAPAATVLFVLTIGVGWVVATGTRVRCACFGAGDDALGGAALVRNGLLTALAVVVAQGPAGAFGSPSAAVLAVSAGALTGLGVTHWNDLRWLLVRGAPAHSEETT